MQTNNDDAIAFYTRFGFKRNGVTLNYYKRLDPPDAAILELDLGAFYTLVPVRPRRRGERRFLRTLHVVSLRPPHGFNPRPRRLSTPTDAFELHPDIRSYGTTLRWRRMA